jgi:N-acetylmuramoyl-L-alanine amidase
MMRGDDVAELQLRLGALGFDAGRVDGIFGPLTRAAVGEFQRNAGLVSDDVCGPDTVDTLVRLEGRGGSASVTAVRERERLRRSLGSLPQLRVVIGAEPEAGTVMADLAASLQTAGVTVLLGEGDWSDQALAANDFGADVYLGLTIGHESTVEATFFAVPGFESDGGRRLAELVVKELPAAPGWGVGTVRGMRLPILRETRAPAVLVHLGDTAKVDENRDMVIASFQRALDAWADDPC